jgi:hypothetical protein
MLTEKGKETTAKVDSFRDLQHQMLAETSPSRIKARVFSPFIDFAL